MPTARQIVSEIHKTLKPLVDSYNTHRSTKSSSTKTINGWSGGNWCTGYRVTIEKSYKKVRLVYIPHYSRDAKYLKNIAIALKASGMNFKIFNYYPFGEPMITEKTEVTDDRDYLEFPFSDS